MREDRDPAAAPGSKALYLSRDAFDQQAGDWSTLDGLPAARETRLLGGLRGVEIYYYGADNDQATAQWRNTWANPLRLPQLVRFTFTTANKRPMPELTVQLKLGEEAGCLENGFSRQCGPRRS